MNAPTGRQDAAGELARIADILAFVTKPMYDDEGNEVTSIQWGALMLERLLQHHERLANAVADHYEDVDGVDQPPLHTIANQLEHVVEYLERIDDKLSTIAEGK